MCAWLTVAIYQSTVSASLTRLAKLVYSSLDLKFMCSFSEIELITVCSQVYSLLYMCVKVITIIKT